MFLNIFLAICCVIVTAVIYLGIDYNQRLKNNKYIAVIQFDKRQFDPQLESKIWSIADWYEFDETADREFEINDLKEHYKIVLEVK